VRKLLRTGPAFAVSTGRSIAASTGRVNAACPDRANVAVGESMFLVLVGLEGSCINAAAGGALGVPSVGGAHVRYGLACLASPRSI
jgi:hypothetical protein